LARLRPSGAAALIAGLALVSGCASLGPARPAPARPAVVVAQPEVLAVDPLSADVAAFFAEVEARRVAQGLMRRDAGADRALAPALLAETYVAVALRDEAPSGGVSHASVLRRWAAPVRYALEFGATVPQATRAADRAQVTALAGRLAASSGHPISLAPAGAEGNFHVLVLSESERRGIAPRLRALVPGIDERAIRLITDLPRETFCMVIAFSRDGSALYSEAVAVVRAEHPDLTRLACYHEELTQGLGLAADSDMAHPSIFNDDQEFALITDHDLLLLRMHYDPRLSPGMTESRARPVVFSIASELVGGAI